MTETRANTRNWRLDIDSGDIAWLVIDKADGGTNVLCREVLQELDEVLAGIQERPPAGLIIMSAKANGFIAGADVHSFSGIETTEQGRELIELGQTPFNRLAALEFPTVCLIHGFCLGGGLELALACRYRVALDDPKTRLGLPEVKLGIHPGWSGTLRLVQLIGAAAAMDLMLTGRTVSARAAAKIGIVDHAVPERHLNNAALALIRRQPPLRRPGYLQKIANTAPVRPLLARYLRRQVGKRVRPEHYPAPYALIDAWRRHAGDEQAMLKAEGESVASLITRPQTRNLGRVFFLQERLKSLRGSVEFMPGHVHVVGAGVMGGDIAAWCALQGLTVTIQDREARFIAPAIKRAEALFQKRIKTPHRVQAAMDRLIPDIQGRGVSKADVVIEAIVENVEAKRALFDTIEPLLKDSAVLATNTSSIDLQDLAAGLSDPTRLVGIHFFNPVAKMQLVEIVKGEATDQAIVDKALQFSRRIDRLPVPVRSSPGFLVNRVLMPYLLEAVVLLQEGVPASVIDGAATDFGMPMGPIELADAVGLDVCHSVATILADKLNIPVPEELGRLMEKGDLGRKTGKGFYSYKRGKPQKQKADKKNHPMEEITDRLILIMLNEAQACLEEGVIADADLVDAGLIFGTGFAPFRGGPMHYAETIGREKIAERLQALSDKLGERFTPHKAWR